MFLTGILIYFLDVDECKLKLHDCTPDQTCKNELGTFACQENPPTIQPSTKPSEKITRNNVTGNINYHVYV